jgi:hypothetical protein
MCFSVGKGPTPLGLGYDSYGKPLRSCPDQALKEARLSLEELQGTEHQILLCLVLNQGISRIATMHA